MTYLQVWEGLSAPPPLYVLWVDEEPGPLQLWQAELDCQLCERPILRLVAGRTTQADIDEAIWTHHWMTGHRGLGWRRRALPIGPVGRLWRDWEHTIGCLLWLAMGEEHTWCECFCHLVFRVSSDTAAPPKSGAASRVRRSRVRRVRG